MCSRDPKKLAGDWRGIRGNFGPPGEKMDLVRRRSATALDDLLADPDIDLIDICNRRRTCTPTWPSRPCGPASTSWSRRRSP